MVGFMPLNRIVAAIVSSLALSLLVAAPSVSVVPQGWDIDENFANAGAIRQTFGTGEHIQAAAVDSESRTVIAGYVNIGGQNSLSGSTTLYSGVNYAVVGRLSNTDESANITNPYDVTFADRGRFVHQSNEAEFHHIALDAADNIYVAGSMLVEGDSKPLLIKLLPGGTPDLYFGRAGVADLETGTVQRGDEPIEVDFSSITGLTVTQNDEIIIVTTDAQGRSYLLQITENGEIKVDDGGQEIVDLPVDFMASQILWREDLQVGLLSNHLFGTNVQSLISFSISPSSVETVSVNIDWGAPIPEVGDIHKVLWTGETLTIAGTVYREDTGVNSAFIIQGTYDSGDHLLTIDPTQFSLLPETLTDPEFSALIQLPDGHYEAFLNYGSPTSRRFMLARPDFQEGTAVTSEGAFDFGSEPAEVVAVAIRGSALGVLVSAGVITTTFGAFFSNFHDYLNWYPDQESTFAPFQPISFNQSRLFVSESDYTFSLQGATLEVDAKIQLLDGNGDFVVASVQFVGVRPLLVIQTFTNEGQPTLLGESGSNVVIHAIELDEQILGMRLNAFELIHVGSGWRIAGLVSHWPFIGDSGPALVFLLDESGELHTNIIGDQEPFVLTDLVWSPTGNELLVSGWETIGGQAAIFRISAEQQEDLSVQGYSFHSQGEGLVTFFTSIDSQYSGNKSLLLLKGFTYPVQIDPLDIVRNYSFALILDLETETEELYQVPSDDLLVEARFIDTKVLLLSDRQVIVNDQVVGRLPAITQWSPSSGETRSAILNLVENQQPAARNLLVTGGSIFLVGGSFFLENIGTEFDIPVPLVAEVNLSAVQDSLLPESWSMTVGFDAIMPFSTGRDALEREWNDPFTSLGYVPEVVQQNSDYLLLGATRFDSFRSTSQVLRLKRVAAEPQPQNQNTGGNSPGSGNTDPGNPKPSLDVPVPTITPSPAVIETWPVKLKRTVTFASGSTRVTTTGRRALNVVARAVPPETNVVCTGFTSGKSTAANRKIALDRARNACAVVQQGNPSVKVSLKTGFSRTGKAIDRRAEVVLTYKK